MDPTAPRADDSRDLLRHDLRSQLTVIRGQAHLLRRRLARLDGLDEGERGWLMERATHIDAAVTTLVARIERMGQE
ncbi:MAG: hypothetical protein M3Q71_03460 [Chloroflexota bacterium]|nr:hypothetical protein [Chloroflexota bacterium]